MGRYLVNSTLDRGADRERTLDRRVYFSEGYFSLVQLFSFAHQLNLIWKMNPQSVIEIGIGNGFVSTYLRRSGIPVITVDINPNLDPDIVAPLHELDRHLSRKQDLVVCCEVLEHMPVSELDNNLSYLKNVGERLFLTLPNYYPNFGFGGLLKIPKLGHLNIDLNIPIPWRKTLAGGPHFWEVGYSTDCTRGAIVERLRKRYAKVSTRRFNLNPYHTAFLCE